MFCHAAVREMATIKQALHCCTSTGMDKIRMILDCA